VTFGLKQISLFPEGLDQLGAATHPSQGLAGGRAQLGKVFRAEVGQLMLFAVAPNVFHRIEFGRIRRQKFQLDGITLRGDKISHQTAAMNRQAVPNDGQPAANVPLQVFQKLDNLRGLDAAGKEPEIEVPDSDARHGRQAFPVERILQDGRLAARGPSAHSVRSLAQAAFVHKHYGSPLLERFFFISGQRRRFQRRMAVSSRWMARPTGRWQLQFNERKIRHTCPG